ncbi:hypothetical protein B0T25DRAFT_354573 [Lasiosphaeria hispida]|uniref:Uncharacterized protein n=1 Tax=Lasiosphaeria hispida TaxID=260671 RepID=A0AAJ0H7K7_9PEZI|nr:hypothetical protein B0T25DRAFT_354573 [Lasiosphaeria hispida]
MWMRNQAPVYISGMRALLPSWSTRTPPPPIGSRDPSHHGDMLDALRPSFDHGAEEEETTGRSCQTFLDSVPRHVILGIWDGVDGHCEFSSAYMYDKFRRDLI